jgi:hypothetical protein
MKLFHPSIFFFFSVDRTGLEVEEVWNKVFDSQKALFAPSVGCLRYATKDHNCGLSLHAVPALLRQPRLGEDKGWHVATRGRD